MNGEFFVILDHPNGNLPLVWDDNELLFFDTEEEAVAAAKESLLGMNFGWEVFEIGCGNCSN